MALAASVTKRPIPPGAIRGIRTSIVRFTLDTDYAAEGYAVTAALCGFASQVLAVIPMGLAHNSTLASATTGYYVSYDQVQGKLQVFTSGGGGAADPAGEAGTGLNGIDGLVVDAFCIGL